MKYIIFSFTIFYCFFSCQYSTQSTANAGWSIQYSNTDNYTYRSIYMANNNSGWIVGDAGIIKQTANGGQSWEIQDSPVQAKLWDICFIDSQTGWVCGDSNTILYTKNAGQSWQKVPLFDSIGPIFLFISFANKDDGWTCTNNGEIFKTADGGLQWQLVKKLPMRGGSRLIVIDPETVYILQGKLYRTYNSGASWDSVAVTYPNHYTGADMFFVDRDKGWITTMNGTGGMVITEFPVIITQNGGASWQPSPYVKDMILSCCYFVNENKGWMAGFKNIYRTSDGGRHWKVDFSSEHLGANRLFFTDENHGWLLTFDGSIYKYDIN